MASTSRKSSSIWSFFSVAEDTKYAVCNSCKQKVSQGGATTNDYCFISCYFIAFKIKSNRYNLNVKYRIGYRYRQISVIKNRNIGISVFSHISTSLIYTVPDKRNFRVTREKHEIFHLTTGECFPVNSQNYRVFMGKLIMRNLFSRE